MRGERMKTNCVQNGEKPPISLPKSYREKEPKVLLNKLAEGYNMNNGEESLSIKEKAMTVTVYTKPACVQCSATYKALDKLGIEYNVVDITEAPEARDYVLALGYMQAPVVVAGDDHWSGFRPDRIKALAAMNVEAVPA
ncbi:Glutaredoxin-like protein NrdH [Mycobacteroides abscessus subsp. massiliense]|nr:Glutaredoxin-like protein NrdH [Mycobacteroides abscessus subsp. massiliense]